MPIHRLVNALLTLSLALAGCAEDGAVWLVDLEGPAGEAYAPGPWGVAVLTDGRPARVFWTPDDRPFEPLPLDPLGAGQFAGQLPPAPVGARIRYYAESDGQRIPASGADAPRSFVVTAPPGSERDARPPPTCSLRFTRPADGETVREADDDNAPQFGLQMTVRVGTDLPPGHAVRLFVGDASYVGRVGVGPAREGEVAFESVTLPSGATTLDADAIPPDSGEPCNASATIEVVPRR